MIIMEPAFLIAPSGSVSQEMLDTSLRTMKMLGFKAIYSEEIKSSFLDYYAGTPERRANELNDVFMDDSAQFVFCARGGMGAVHTLNQVSFDSIKGKDKIFIGYSDITVLLNLLHERSSIRCLHGPTVGKPYEEYDYLTLSTLKDAINKKNYTLSVKSEDILVAGECEGEIIGGNLSLLTRTLGTPYEIDTTDKILLLEQNVYTGRMIYDILWQMKLAGKFDAVKGIILGGFTRSDSNVDEYLIEFFKDFPCPVLLHQPIGHHEPNVTVPLGETCYIDTKKFEWGIKFNS